MPVYKIKKPTKDGRSWYFKVNYKDDNGKYHSTTRSMFSTKKEALEEEAKFIINMNKFIKSSNKTINDLVKEYLIYQETRIKKQTFYTTIYFLSDFYYCIILYINIAISRK